MFSILCMPFFIALLSQNYIAKSGAIDVNQRFLGFIIELNFRWYYLKLELTDALEKHYSFRGPINDRIWHGIDNKLNET